MRQGGAAAAGPRDLAAEVAAEKAARAAQRSGPYKHLMTGVSYMLPFVVAGGLLIAISFALGGIYVFDDAHKGTLGQALFLIGAKNAFALMVPMLAGYIAYSIADRPGIAPGAIGGMLAEPIGAGFLGGIVAGFLAGYVVAFLNKTIQLPRTLEGLKPVLILPLLGTTIVGLLMIYVIGAPVAQALAAMTDFLKGMQGANAILLGVIIGAMMAFDMGGPVNKAAYTFATGLLASNIYMPMAAAMVAGMTPPLGLALATKLFADRFTADEHEAGNAAAVLGISFITEGAIPFAARDPFRVIPSLMVGSAVAGVISMLVGAELHVPHGGVFVLMIPNAVTHLVGYLVALVAGTVVTAVLLRIVKPSLKRRLRPTTRRSGALADPRLRTSDRRRRSGSPSPRTPSGAEHLAVARLVGPRVGVFARRGWPGSRRVRAGRSSGSRYSSRRPTRPACRAPGARGSRRCRRLPAWRDRDPADRGNATPWAKRRRRRAGRRRCRPAPVCA